MAVFPCPTKSLCIDPSTPFANLSAELPDTEIFIGRNTGFGPAYPPLGSLWIGVGCTAFCESTISQADADQCAARNNIGCLSPLWPIDTPGLDRFGNLVPIPHNRPVFFNTPQTAIVNCPDGNPFSFTVAAGQFAAFSQILANAEALSYALLQAENHLLCIGNLTNTLICANTEYSDAVVGSGAFLTNANACWAVFGVLPPGVEIDLDFVGGCFTGSTTLHFFGTPTVPGSYSFAIQLEDGAGDFMVKNVTLNVAGITNGDEIPNGTVGEAYDAQFAVFGFTNPIFSIESGMLPDGLSMSNTGEITGTPTMQDEETFTVQVTELTTGFTCLQDVQLIVMQGCAPAPIQQDSFANPAGGGRGASYQRPAGKYLIVAENGQLDNWDVSGPLAVFHDTLLIANSFSAGGQSMDFCPSTAQWLAAVEDSNTGDVIVHFIGQNPVTHNLIDVASIDLGVALDTFQSLIVDQTTKIGYVLTAQNLYSIDLVAKTVLTTVNLLNGVNLTSNFVIPPDNATLVTVHVGSTKFYTVGQWVRSTQGNGFFQVSKIVNGTDMQWLYPPSTDNNQYGVTMFAAQAMDTSWQNENNVNSHLFFGYDPASQNIYIGRRIASSFSLLLDRFHGSGLTQNATLLLGQVVDPTITSNELGWGTGGMAFNPGDGKLYGVRVANNNNLAVSNNYVYRITPSTGALSSPLIYAHTFSDGPILFDPIAQQFWLEFFAGDGGGGDEFLKVICCETLKEVASFDVTTMGLSARFAAGSSGSDAVNSRFYVPLGGLTNAYGPM